MNVIVRVNASCDSEGEAMQRSHEFAKLPESTSPMLD
jgi:hypothetical protein